MKSLLRFLAFVLIPVFALSGCMKDDIDELKKRASENEARIAALEEWQKTVNGQIGSLQGIIGALEANDYVTGVTPFDTPAPGGYTITFTKSNPITIMHGAKGADGKTPVISVDIHTDGKYYWKLDPGTGTADWMRDGSNNMIPAAAVAPKVAIGSDGKWYISPDGSATGTPPGADWTDTGVNATGPQGPQGIQGDAIFAENGVDNTNADYVEFTLADGTTKIQVPKYKKIGISFTQPTEFIPNTSQIIDYTVSGGTYNEVPDNIIIAGLPAGWKYSVNYGSRQITIIAPLRVTESNYTGEAAILAGVGNQATAMYSLSVSAKLNFAGPTSNTKGAVYYQKGIPTGIVYIAANTPGDGTGRVVSLDEFYDKTNPGSSWGPMGTDTNATDAVNGRENMATIKVLNNDFSDYPAFRWVDALNGTVGTTTYTPSITDIWYLPAVDELIQLFDAWNVDRTTFHSWLTNVGGTGISLQLYYSSSQHSLGMATGILFNSLYTPSYTEVSKNLRWRVRAILAF